MATQKQKEKKKKDREKLAKSKVLLRREALRKERKLAADEQVKERVAHEIVHGKPMPIIKNPAALAQREAMKTRTVSDKLKKNLEILEALEREYEAEQAARTEINTKLESEGHKTMREKMDALHKKALVLTGKAEALAEATEEYVAHHNEEEIVVEPIETTTSQNSEK